MGATVHTEAKLQQIKGFRRRCRFQYEHEHGFESRLVEHVSKGGSKEIKVGECIPIEQMLFFGVHLSGKDLYTCWLGPVIDPDHLSEYGTRLWDREGPRVVAGTGVEVSWCESRITLWCESSSPACARLFPALRAGRAVLGLVPRIGEFRRGSMPEPFIASSAEFAYDAVGAVRPTTG